MLISVNDLIGIFIHATDGDLGKAHDFYFDDQQWAIRYLAVDTSSWLVRRRILISPVAIPAVAPGSKRFMTALTRAQVRESPAWESDKPISREYEMVFADYYKYPYYWRGTSLWGYASYPASMLVWAALPMPTADKRTELKAEAERAHLRGTRAFSKFTLETAEGEIGTVDDLIFDERNWEIRYLVLVAGNWLSGRKVLISPRWIAEIDWAQSKIRTRVSRAAIRDAPVYDGPTDVTSDYEARLCASFGKPYYSKQSW